MQRIIGHETIGGFVTFSAILRKCNFVVLRGSCLTCDIWFYASLCAQRMFVVTFESVNLSIFLVAILNSCHVLLLVCAVYLRVNSRQTDEGLQKVHKLLW